MLPGLPFINTLQPKKDGVNGYELVPAINLKAYLGVV